MDNQIKLNQNLILEEIEDYFIEMYENLDESKQASFKVIFKDLNQIKNLIVLKKVTISDIKWFFNLDLFHILSDDDEAENRVFLNEVYNLLLNCSIIAESKDVHNHASILLEQEKILKEKESCFRVLEELCPILECAIPLPLKQVLKEITELRPYIKEKIEPYFFKLPNTKKLSPIALEALNNNLRNYL